MKWVNGGRAYEMVYGKRFMERASNESNKDVLAISSAWHRLGTQEVIELVMLSRPVVHWQVVSCRLQPASGTAEAKQAIYISKVSDSFLEVVCIYEECNARKFMPPGPPSFR